jgi:glycosyltransferase involved in cell wall biosynthesis
LSEPLVSVVIPTHNRAQLLRRAIASVLSQTHQNLEVIVLDDCSTDETGPMVKAITDSRVRLVTPESRLGSAKARNMGIDISSGRFVAFIDDDDEWLEQKAERQLAAFGGPEPPALVYTGLWIAKGTRRRYGVLKIDGNAFDRLLALPGPVTTSGFMVDRQRVKAELWFDESVGTFEDMELLIRISRKWPVAVLPQPLYVWHQHDGPRLSEPRGQARGRRRIIDKFADDLAVRPWTAAHLFFRLAIAESRLGNRDAVRSSLLAASAADPSNLRLRLLGSTATLGTRAAVLGLACYRLAGRLRRALRPEPRPKVPIPERGL